MQAQWCQRKASFEVVQDLMRLHDVVVCAVGASTKYGPPQLHTEHAWTRVLTRTSVSLHAQHGPGRAASTNPRAGPDSHLRQQRIPAGAARARAHSVCAAMIA
jgi:hypothetical protein